MCFYMARGGLGYEGIGFQAATFKAGAGIKALVEAANRDAVVGIPVVVTSAGDTVDLGNAGDVPFGFIDVYENDGHVGVQFRGFREDVPVVATGVTPGRVCLLDGSGALKDTASGIGVKQSMSKTVTTGATEAGDAIVTITAAGKAELADGKDITVTLAVGTATATATAIETALKADEDVKAFFDVTRSTATVILTAKVPADNDDTMEIEFTAGDTGAVMGDTTDVAGVADRKIGLPIFINTDATAKTATVFLG